MDYIYDSATLSKEVLNFEVVGDEFIIHTINNTYNWKLKDLTIETVEDSITIFYQEYIISISETENLKKINSIPLVYKTRIFTWYKIIAIAIIIFATLSFVFQNADRFIPDTVYKRTSENLLEELDIDYDCEKSLCTQTHDLFNIVKRAIPELEHVDIYVSHNQEVNAFAIPGGIIIVNMGLIKAVDNPNQLLAVILHESGHIYHRDPQNMFAKSILIGILSYIVGGQGGVELANLATLKYGRDMEYKADKYALEKLKQLNIDILALEKFLRKFDDEDESGLFEELMSTHPHTDDRIERLQNMY